MTEDRLKKRWRDEDEQAVEAAFAALLQHVQGRKALWWLLTIGRVGAQPYSNNALNTAFNCGELNVGQQVLDKVTSVSPEGYLIMMKEMADERTRRDGELRDARTKSRPDSYTEPGAESDSGTE